MSIRTRLVEVINDILSDYQEHHISEFLEFVDLIPPENASRYYDSKRSDRPKEPPSVAHRISMGRKWYIEGLLSNEVRQGRAEKFGNKDGKRYKAIRQSKPISEITNYHKAENTAELLDSITINGPIQPDDIIVKCEDGSVYVVEWVPKLRRLFGEELERINDR